MAQTAKIPNRGAIRGIGGKTPIYTTLVEVPRGPIDTKQVLEVLTDDGSVYRWSRFRDSEPFTFEHRVRPDGSKDSARRPLPRSIAHFVEIDDELRY